MKNKMVYLIGIHQIADRPQNLSTLFVSNFHTTEKEFKDYESLFSESSEDQNDAIAFECPQSAAAIALDDSSFGFIDANRDMECEVQSIGFIIKPVKKVKGMKVVSLQDSRKAIELFNSSMQFDVKTFWKKGV